MTTKSSDMTRHQDFSDAPLPGSLVACTALSMIFWMSCVGTEVGNPQTIESEIDFDAYEHQDPRALTLESGISIDRAWLHIESIEFRDAADCDGQEVSQIQGPFAVDLLSGRELPEKPVLTHRGQGFCKTLLRLRTAADETLADGAPESLRDASLVVEGTYEDGTPFTIAAELNETYVITARDERGFAFDETTNPLVGLALNTLVESTLRDEKIEPLEDGSVVIDKMNNQSSLSGLRRDLRASLRLFDDRGDDAEVDPEADVLLGEGELSP